jgi:competence protein ComEC
MDVHTGGLDADPVSGRRNMRRAHCLSLSYIARAFVTNITADRGRWILWTPVFLGSGIAAYFSLSIEPAIWLGPILVGIATFLLLAARRSSWMVLLFISLLIAATGFSVAQLRTYLVAAPVLERDVGPLWVSGRVVDIQNRTKGPRVVLDRLHLPRVEPALTPNKARIRLHKKNNLEIGQRISVLSKLSPPPEPVFPGAYDFQRRAWFEKLGAVGFALSQVRVVNDVFVTNPGAAGSKTKAETTDIAGTTTIALAISALRQTIAERIRTAQPSPEGAIAAALITGDRSAIPADIIEAMRDSGLAHLLAISGLHMGLVAATIFFAVRALLAMWERGTLRYPVKKWAAVAAIIGSFAYLLLSGMTVPTQRAFLMTGVVLLAIILDRTAISLRLVAWAATFILLITPEAILGASFQMSFAAVVVLVAAYEMLRDPVGAWLRGRGLWRRLLTYFAGVAATTLLAGIATGLIALFHFNRIALFGLAANMVAVPLTAIWVMPWAVAVCILMPFGLEAIPLAPMVWGLELIVATATGVASWDGAVRLVPAMPVLGLGFIAIGGLWLCLWRRNIRLFGLALIAAGVLTIPLNSPPDIIASNTGRLMAVRAPDGSLSLSSNRREKFSAANWLRRDGRDQADSWPWSVATETSGMRCDSLGCIYDQGAEIIAFVHDERALLEDCQTASIIVSAVPIRGNCPSADAIIDRFDLWRDGTHAIWLTKAAPRIKTVAGVRGIRPWSPARTTGGQSTR